LFSDFVHFLEGTEEKCIKNIFTEGAIEVFRRNLSMVGESTHAGT
jgi:hypothetical protein